jgi:hypothetical protein
LFYDLATTPWTLAQIYNTVHPDLDTNQLLHLDGKKITSIISQARLEAVVAAANLQTSRKRCFS